MSKNTSVKKINKNTVELTVDVTAEQFDHALDKAFEKVVKDIKADGFRPGKMPKNVFIKRFGWESLYSEAIEIALQETYVKAIENSKTNPASEPKVDLDINKIQKGQGFTYTLTYEIWQEPTLGQYKGVEVKKMPVKVTAAKVKKYIDNVLSSKQETVIKDTPAQLNDTVIIDFEGFMNGEAFEGGKGENYPLELGSNSFIPGFEEQLVGVSPESNVEVNVVFPENYHEHLAGKPATFKVTVHEVKSKVTPELTDDLVKELDLPNVQNVKEYKAYVSDLLTKEETKKSEMKFMEDIFKKIIKNSEIIVPNGVIEQELEQHVHSVEEQAKQYGVPTEVLLQYSGYANMEKFKEDGRKNLKDRIVNDIIVEEIIKKENIETSPEEIEARYVAIANDMKKELKEVKSTYSLSQISYHIRYEKALDLIKNSAVIIEK